MTNNQFFNESMEQSRIKAAIVSQYFWTWAKIITSTIKRRGNNNRIAYIDLFAGPGRYIDGTKSTPLMVLEMALKDDAMREMLVTMFNDANKDNTGSLESAINEIQGIERLRYKPIIHNYEVGSEIVKMFEDMNLIPTLFFVDPWGYKGLSLRLINSVLKDWGCDCIFFFNYNRINMGLENDAVKAHMDALFGEARANEVRSKLENLNPHERELTIVDQIAQALKDMGGKYVLPFRFRSSEKNRASHHLIFVSKNFKGYEVMKDVMAKKSSSENEGVSTFEYNPATQLQPMLYAFRPRPLSELKETLKRDFAGKQLSMRMIYETHSIDTPYTGANYKEALRQLEAENQIVTDPPANKRRKQKGILTFGDDVMVRFP